MKAADVLRLVALGAIWGSSYLFIRIVAPVLGPAATANLRLLIGGIALALWLHLTGFRPQWRRYWLPYTVVGMMNSGLPFLLYAYAALSLGAGEMSVINATSPMWGALFGALVLGERMNALRGLGLALGVAGVALIAQPEGDTFQFLAVGAALLASASYGFTVVFLRRWAAHIPGKGLAVGTQLTCAVLLLPLLALAPPPAEPTPLVIASLLALALLCSAVAYVIYFRLVANIGPAGALTVTYLVPLFGVLWGALFLGEALTPAMLGGAALVILGTVLVLRN